jgi:hypothetical protein
MALIAHWLMEGEVSEQIGAKQDARSSAPQAQRNG